MQLVQGETAAPSRKLLIADDDPAIVRFLSARCARMGFEVQTAHNGLQAIVIARTFHPDVLIVDMVMPEVDGMSVVQHLLKAHRRHPDIIFVTAGSFAETAARCESVGATHIRKGAGMLVNLELALSRLFPDMPNIRVTTTDPISSRGEVAENPRILIVDSGSELIMSLNSRLRKYGVDVVRARDAVSGYQVALRERPTLLIIRYVVGTGDAQYILTKLRSQVEIDPIPAIVLSDNPLDADIKGRMTRSLGNEGIVSFMTSSILLEDLFVEIEKYCAFRRSPGPRTPQEHVAKDEAQQDFSSSATVAPAATGAEGGIQTAPSDGES